MNGVCDRSSGAQYDLGMRPRPQRLDRLPQQYFVGLLGRVAAAAAADGEPLVDLGRGNPETGPPPHVVEALREAVLDPGIHGYSPIRGLPQTKEAIAGRYRDVYGVELDPETEVALIPGTKTAIVELALSLCDEGDTLLLPDPYYPDYPSGPALAGARLETVPLLPSGAGRPSSPPRLPRLRCISTIPRIPAPSACPTASSRTPSPGRTGRAAQSSTTLRTSTSCSTAGGPRAFSRRPARKTSASRCGRCRRPTGWRAGASASSSATPRSSSGSTCSTITAASASSRRCSQRRSPRSTGPQDSVAERVDAYERRRDTIAAALPDAPVCEGTFYVWFKLPDGLTAEALLAEHRVVVAPGEGFGPSGAGWVRISLAVDDEQIELGAERLQRAFAAVAGAAH